MDPPVKPRSRPQPIAPKFPSPPIDSRWSQPRYRLRRHRLVILLLVCLLIITSISCGVLLTKYFKYRRGDGGSPLTQQQQLTRQLSQVAEVPAGPPIISTVLNNSKLTNPTLAKEARNGDKLFIFPQAKRLILYRPSDKKVVDMLTIQN